MNEPPRSKPLNRRRGWRSLDPMLDHLRAVLGVAPEDFRTTVRAAWKHAVSPQEAARVLREFRAAWLSDCPLFVAAAAGAGLRTASQLRTTPLTFDLGRHYGLPHFTESDVLDRRAGIEIYQTDAETVVDMGEWRWVRYSESSSVIEGRLMRHCGNSPRNTGILYSLRHRLRRHHHWQEFWMPHLTMVVEAGRIIEVRGRANSKPRAKYHRMLLEFLVRTDLVAGFGAKACGGDLFSVADLSPALQKELVVRRAGDVSGFWRTEPQPMTYPGSRAMPALPASLRGLVILGLPPLQTTAPAPARPPEPSMPIASANGTTPSCLPVGMPRRNWELGFFLAPAPLAFPAGAILWAVVHAVSFPRGTAWTAGPAFGLGAVLCLLFGFWANLGGGRPRPSGAKPPGSSAHRYPEGEEGLIMAGRPLPSGKGTWMVAGPDEG